MSTNEDIVRTLKKEKYHLGRAAESLNLPPSIVARIGMVSDPLFKLFMELKDLGITRVEMDPADDNKIIVWHYDSMGSLDYVRFAINPKRGDQISIRLGSMNEFFSMPLDPNTGKRFSAPAIVKSIKFNYGADLMNQDD